MNIKQLFGNGQKNTTRRSKRKIERTLTKNDLMDGDVSVKSGKWIEIGSFQLGDRQAGEVGQGTSRLDPMEQGRPYFKIQNDSPSVISGMIQIKHESPQGEQTPLVLRRKNSEFNESTPTERIVLPRVSSDKQNVRPAGPKSYITIYMKADSDDTISKSDTTLDLPATLYNLPSRY